LALSHIGRRGGTTITNNLFLRVELIPFWKEILIKYMCVMRWQNFSISAMCRKKRFFKYLLRASSALHVFVRSIRAKEAIIL
jgi:hypothetical protein